MTGAQLFRATLFHTPANPFREEEALRSYADGGLLVRAGRIVASGDFADVRQADPDAAVIDCRGGVLLPGLVDAHVHLDLDPALATPAEQAAVPPEVAEQVAWKNAATLYRLD